MKKAKITVGKLGKGILGESDVKTKRIKIDVKAHKGDKAEEASTIKHEMLHVKHPKMTEKEVYKASAKTKIPAAEQKRLLALARTKALNHQVGAMKRKYKRGDSTQPGELINLVNSQKAERTAILGAI